MLSGASGGGAAGETDGTWLVELVTLSAPGRCRPSYRSTIEIRGGQITGTGEGNRGTYKLTGQVKAGGTLEWRSAGGDPGEFSAVLDGDQIARGRWRTSSGCHGTVTVTRQ